MLIHHFSAISAWLLYLQGGYGHALSLVGSICELTNPFMNLRRVPACPPPRRRAGRARPRPRPAAWPAIALRQVLPEHPRAALLQAVRGQRALLRLLVRRAAPAHPHAPPSARAPPRAPACSALARSWLAVRICFACFCGSYIIYQQRGMWSQLPLWRAAAFVGFYGVGTALNLTWGLKIFKGAYRVLFHNQHIKEG